MLGKAPVCLLIRLVKNQVDQIKPEKATILETDASHKLFLKTTQFLMSIGGKCLVFIHLEMYIIFTTDLCHFLKIKLLYYLDNKVGGRWMLSITDKRGLYRDPLGFAQANTEVLALRDAIIPAFAMETVCCSITWKSTNPFLKQVYKGCKWCTCRGNIKIHHNDVAFSNTKY